MTEKIFADVIPKCTEEDCDGLVKPGKVSANILIYFRTYVYQNSVQENMFVISDILKCPAF